MERWRKIVLVLCLTAAGAGLFGGFPQRGFACSCAAIPDPLQALQQADSVFSGTVTRMSGGNFSVRWLFPGARAIDLEVANVWKGEVAERTTVYTAPDTAACGASFRVGETYLVYTYRGEGGRAETNACTRTKLLHAAAEDLQALGPAQPPAAGGPGTMAAPALWAALAAVAGCLALYAFRKHRRRIRL